MSRSGFYEVDDWDRDLILAIGRVQARIASARRGKRGQAFLRKALAALDQMEDKRLAGGTFGVSGGCMCIMSSIATETGKAAAIEGYDKYCGEVVCQRLARGFDVAHVLIQDLTKRFSPNALFSFKRNMFAKGRVPGLSNKIWFAPVH